MRIRCGADEPLLRLVPLVRSSASGRVGHARVPDSGVHEARGIRAVREGAEPKTPVRIPVP
jgi:hypothetical protein